MNYATTRKCKIEMHSPKSEEILKFVWYKFSFRQCNFSLYLPCSALVLRLMSRNFIYLSKKLST